MQRLPTSPFASLLTIEVAVAPRMKTMARNNGRRRSIGSDFDNPHWRDKLWLQTVILLLGNVPKAHASLKALQNEALQLQDDILETYDEFNLDSEPPCNFKQLLKLCLMSRGLPKDDINATCRVADYEDTVSGSGQQGAEGTIIGTSDPVSVVAAGGDTLAQNRAAARAALRRGDLAEYRRCITQIKEIIRAKMSNFVSGSGMNSENVGNTINTISNFFQGIAGFFSSG